MNASLLLTLAWRNLWRNPRRTGIVLAAIVLGVWAMIFMNALMRGMTDQMVRNGLNGLPGEVQLHHPQYRDDPSVGNTLPYPRGALLEALSGSSPLGWSARVRVPALLASEYDARGVVLLGVDPLQEERIDASPGDLIAGRFLGDAMDDGLVLGEALASRLRTKVGRRLVVMAQDSDNAVAERGLRVIGIYRARLQGDEEAFAYLGRAPAQALLGLGSRVSEIAVSGGDYRAVDRWLPALARAAGSDVETLPWYRLAPFLGTMLTVQDSFALIFIVIVFSVLSFGLVNTLAMAVFERVREIGLMLALGMSPALVRGQILVESLLLLGLGLVLGVAFALATLLSLGDGIDLSSVAQGMEMVEMGAVLHPSLEPRDVASAVVLVLGLGLLASLLPAWRAARLDPVDALARQD